jgi:hypothetical protein
MVVLNIFLNLIGDWAREKVYNDVETVSAVQHLAIAVQSRNNLMKIKEIIVIIITQLKLYLI